MKKYDMRKIMNKAWSVFRANKARFASTGKKKYIITFGEALRRAWMLIKAEMVYNETERMFYGRYKRNYSECPTVNGSYDFATKTIEVYINRFNYAKKAY